MVRLKRRTGTTMATNSGVENPLAHPVMWVKQ
jgi:hypothetical protein